MPNVTLPFGLNFRATAGLVVDGAGFVPQLSEYSTSGDGTTFYTTAKGYGWNAPGAAQPARTRDLSTTANPRFCGDAFIFNGAQDELRIDTAQGTYAFRIAAALNCYFAVYDGDAASPQILVDRATTPVSSGYIDATGVVRASEAAWLSDNAAASVTCLSGRLRIVIGKAAGGDGYGTYHSLDIALTGAINPPTFTAQPASIEVSQPATATFSATMGGGTYSALQWQTRPNSGGTVTDVAGANGTSYTTGATNLSMSGSQYRLAATWAAGTEYSNWATLTVNAGPPGAVADVTGEATGGTTATVSFTAGTPAATSHTLELETPSGAGNWTAPTSTLAGTTFSVTGLAGVTQYRPRVRPSNGAGPGAWSVGTEFTTDNVATGGGTIPIVVVTPVAPAFTAQPQSATRVEGLSVTFSATATGVPAPTLQWQRNNGAGWVNIGGATGSSYSFTTALADTGAQFQAVATNSAGVATSTAAALTVTAAPVAPSISAQPQAVTVVEGQPATFTVSAGGTAPLSYQWRFNGTNIAGAVGASYTRTTVLADNGGLVSVRVSNSAGFVDSAAVALTVQELVTPTEPVMQLVDGLKRVLPYVPGCPDQTALVHLRDAAVEFCTQSLAWRAELTATTVAGQATYTIPLPAGSLLVKMLQFDVGGDTRGGMPGPSRGRDLRRGTYSRDVAWTDDRATVTLNPPPSNSGETVTLYVALKPSDDAETLPLDLWQHHAKTLEHGALGTLMAMPTQPWSNPQLAGFNDDRFKTRTDSAASAAARGHSRATGRTKPFLF
jgi:hypothetical protein